MYLSIYSLKKVLFEGQAESVNCKTTNGEITILDHHRPLVSVLERGVVKVVDEKKQEKFFEVASGFVEAQATNSVRMLVDQ